MYKKQKQKMDTLIRVRAFTDAFPMTGVPGAASAREMLSDVVRQLRAYASAQVSGRELSRAEAQRVKDQVAQVFDHHMRKIVTIARSQIEPQSDVGLPTALRMPKLPMPPQKVLAACDGMIEAARAFEPVFVAAGLPADFLAQATAARDELERVMGSRANQVRTHVAAREGLKVQLRRGRRALERLDALVRSTYRTDTVVLKSWQATKRIHQVPGGAGARETAGGAEAVTAAETTAAAELPKAA
jgi:hypothetical protein